MRGRDAHRLLEGVFGDSDSRIEGFESLAPAQIVSRILCLRAFKDNARAGRPGTTCARSR